MRAQLVLAAGSPRMQQVVSGSCGRGVQRWGSSRWRTVSEFPLLASHFAPARRGREASTAGGRVCPVSLVAIIYNCRSRGGMTAGPPGYRYCTPGGRGVRRSRGPRPRRSRRGDRALASLLVWHEASAGRFTRLSDATGRTVIIGATGRGAREDRWLASTRCTNA